MENDTLSFRFEVGSMNFCGAEIENLTLDVSTDDSEVSNKLLYLAELGASILIHYSKEREVNKN